MKRTNSTYILTVIIFLLLTIYFTGCATQVPIQVQRPPTWNTLGIKRLAIIPFKTTDGSSLQRHAAALLTNETQSKIQATNHFTLVNSADVERAMSSSNGNVENLTDAIFTGQVMSVSVSNTSQQGQYTNRDGSVTRYIDYRRDVTISFSYSMSRARGSEIIGSNTETFSTYSSARNDPNQLISAEILVQRIIQNNLSRIGWYVAPHMVTEHRKFEKETSKDKVVKERAKEADAMLKAGSYKNALDAYKKIYENTGSFAAAFNAGLLIEILGDMNESLAFFQSAYNQTGNPRFMTEVSRLQKMIGDVGVLASYVENQSQQDKVIALMVDTLPARLPDNPRVALINTSRDNFDLAQRAVNSITEGFIAKSIIIADRNNLSLVEMEKEYQFSGNVSDEEMIRIGNAAGVNTFVLIEVIGSGGTRRLSVRILDVERNTIIYQSPQSEDMNF